MNRLCVHLYNQMQTKLRCIIGDFSCKVPWRLGDSRACSLEGLESWLTYFELWINGWKQRRLMPNFTAPAQTPTLRILPQLPLQSLNVQPANHDMWPPILLFTILEEEKSEWKAQNIVWRVCTWAMQSKPCMVAMGLDHFRQEGLISRLGDQGLPANSKISSQILAGPLGSLLWSICWNFHHIVFVSLLLCVERQLSMQRFSLPELNGSCQFWVSELLMAAECGLLPSLQSLALRFWGCDQLKQIYELGLLAISANVLMFCCPSSVWRALFCLRCATLFPQASKSYVSLVSQYPQDVANTCGIRRGILPQSIQHAGLLDSKNCAFPVFAKSYPAHGVFQHILVLWRQRNFM